jgi:hypothetical protein
MNLFCYAHSASCLALLDLCLIHIYKTDSVTVYRHAKHLPGPRLESSNEESGKKESERKNIYFIAQMNALSIDGDLNLLRAKALVAQFPTRR